MPGGTHPGCYGTPKFLGYYRGSATPNRGIPGGFLENHTCFPFCMRVRIANLLSRVFQTPLRAKKVPMEVFGGYFQTLSRVKLSHYVHKKLLSKLFADSFSYAKPLLMTPSDTFYPLLHALKTVCKQFFTRESGIDWHVRVLIDTKSE